MRPILTALTTTGIQENPLHLGDNLTACVSVSFPFKLESFSIYLHFSRLARYLFCVVSVLSGLFSHTVILSPICGCLFGNLLHDCMCSRKFKVRN